MTITVKDLSEGMGFFLPKIDHESTNANYLYTPNTDHDNYLYTVVKVCKEGIYARGLGTLDNSVFWLPNFVYVLTSLLVVC